MSSLIRKWPALALALVLTGLSGLGYAQYGPGISIPPNLGTLSLGTSGSGGSSNALNILFPPATSVGKPVVFGYDGQDVVTHSGGAFGPGIAFGTAPTTTTGTGTSVSLNFPGSASVTGGAALIVGVGTQTTTADAITAPDTNWTSLGCPLSPTADGMYACFYCKQVASVETTPYVFTLATSATYKAFALQIAGAQQCKLDNLVTTSNSSLATQNSLTIPSMTTQYSNDYIIQGIFQNVTPGTPTFTDSYGTTLVSATGMLVTGQPMAGVHVITGTGNNVPAQTFGSSVNDDAVGFGLALISDRMTTGEIMVNGMDGAELADLYLTGGQMTNISAYNGGFNDAGSLEMAPLGQTTQPTLAVIPASGSASTSYTYYAECADTNDRFAAISPSATIATGPGTISSSARIRVSIPWEAGCYLMRVYKTNSSTCLYTSATPNLDFSVYPPRYYLDDTGQSTASCTDAGRDQTADFATTGQIASGTDNSVSGAVTISNGSAAAHTTLQSMATSSYNFNFPATACSSGQLFDSGGGGSNPITCLDAPRIPLVFPISATAATTSLEYGVQRAVKAGTIENAIMSVQSFTCSGNPTLKLQDCANDINCGSPTTISTSSTITGTGQAVLSLSSTAVAAGDNLAVQFSAGTCTVFNGSIVAMMRSGS